MRTATLCIGGLLLMACDGSVGNEPGVVSSSGPNGFPIPVAAQSISPNVGASLPEPPAVVAPAVVAPASDVTPVVDVAAEVPPVGGAIEVPVATAPAAASQGGGVSVAELTAQSQAFYSTLTVPQVQDYLTRIVPSVAARVLSTEERQLVQQQAGLAIPQIVEGWTKDPGFARSARLFLEETLGVSGVSTEVNFNLPGNLAAHLTTNELPWSEILTADYCVDDAGDNVECDTGAPYAAGVLTTRAFMIARQSRFNLTRASTLMKNFACQGYPMSHDLQPLVEKSVLIPMFQAQTPEEQTEEEAANGFGNGFGCYTCHGQFSSHAQLFVKYDRSGMYHEDADGIQNPDEELGVANDGLMASHFSDPDKASSETAQVFGQNADTLAQAAAIIADDPLFVSCTAERFMDYVLGLPRGSVPYDRQLVNNVRARSVVTNEKPTLSSIVAALLTEPAVIQSILMSGSEPQ